MFLQRHATTHYLVNVITQLVEIPAGKCAVHSGIYEYKTGLGEKRTIPVVKFEESRLPNPDYIK